MYYILIIIYILLIFYLLSPKFYVITKEFFTYPQYSFGNVSCLIACRDKNLQTNKLCFKECVKNKVIY